MTGYVAMVLEILVSMAIPIRMSAQPLAHETPVAQVGSGTIINYWQVAADPRLPAAERVKAEQAQLDDLLVEAMVDPILEKYRITVTEDEILTATPPIMKHARTVADSVELHRRIGHAIRRVRAGEDQQKVYDEELAAAVLHNAGIKASISMQSFAGHFEILISDADVERFLRVNSLEKTQQRYHDYALRIAKNRKVDELVRKYAVEHSLAFDEARELFWNQMSNEIGLKVLVPVYRLPLFRKDRP